MLFEKEMKKLKDLYQAGCYEPEFYAKKILNDNMFDSYENFIHIPFSYKDEIRSTTAFERTTCSKDDVYGIFSSSGTTGEKTYYVYSKEDKRVHEEFVRAFYKELGVSSDDLGAVCAPVDTGVMAHTMMWQFVTMGAGYVNCPEPSPGNIANLIRELPVTVVATRPDVVSTMAHTKEWTECAQKSKVKKLLLGGGFISGERRKMLEKTWDADVYNMFGMSEMFGPMAGECRCKDGQHYLDDYLMIEIIDPITLLPVKGEEYGIAVYTSLWNKGFPLLRYWTDDVMKISYQECKCGSCMPRIFYGGRMGDCIQKDGQIIFPCMLEEIILKYGYHLEYKVTYAKQNNKCTVFIEKEESMEQNRDMEKAVAELFGDNTEMKYLFPNEIGYPGHGKRFFEYA